MEWVAGPFRSYLRGLVLEHLSKFITNIDIKHIGVASDIVLRDVELNTSQLNEASTPRFAAEFRFCHANFAQDFVPASSELELRTVRVASLKIIIPWLSLFSDPIRVQLHRVECRVGRKGAKAAGSSASAAPSAASFAPPTSARSTHSGSDSKRSGVTSGKASSSAAASSGWLQGALTSILANAQVDISSLSMSYTHGDAQLTITAERLGVVSCSETEGAADHASAPPPPPRDGLLPPPSPFVAAAGSNSSTRAQREWVAGYVEPAGSRGLVRKRAYLHGVVVGLNYTRASGRRYQQAGPDGDSKPTQHPDSSSESPRAGGIIFSEPHLLDKLSIEGRFIIALNPLAQHEEDFCPPPADAGVLHVPIRPSSEQERCMVRGVFRGHAVLSMVDVQVSHIRVAISIRQLHMLKELTSHEASTAAPTAAAQHPHESLAHLQPRPTSRPPRHSPQLPASGTASTAAAGAHSEAQAPQATTAAGKPSQGLLAWAWGSVTGGADSAAGNTGAELAGADADAAGADAGGGSSWFGSWLGDDPGELTPIEEEREVPRVLFCAVHLEGLTFSLVRHDAATLPATHLPGDAAAGTHDTLPVQGTHHRRDRGSSSVDAEDDFLRVPVARLGLVTVTPQSSARPRAATLLHGETALQVQMAESCCRAAIHSTFTDDERGVPVSCVDFDCKLGVLSVSLGRDATADNAPSRRLDFTAPDDPTTEQTCGNLLTCSISEPDTCPNVPSDLGAGVWSLFGAVSSAPDRCFLISHGRMSSSKQHPSDEHGVIDVSDAADFVSHVALPVSRSSTIGSDLSDGGGTSPVSRGASDERRLSNASHTPMHDPGPSVNALWCAVSLGAVDGTLCGSNLAVAIQAVQTALNDLKPGHTETQLDEEQLSVRPPRPGLRLPNLQLHAHFGGLRLQDRRFQALANASFCPELSAHISTAQVSANLGRLPRLLNTTWPAPARGVAGVHAHLEGAEMAWKIHQQTTKLINLKKCEVSVDVNVEASFLSSFGLACVCDSLAGAVHTAAVARRALTAAMTMAEIPDTLKHQLIHTPDLHAGMTFECSKVHLSGSLLEDGGMHSLAVQVSCSSLLASTSKSAFLQWDETEQNPCLRFDCKAVVPSAWFEGVPAFRSLPPAAVSQVKPLTCNVVLQSQPGMIHIHDLLKLLSDLNSAHEALSVVDGPSSNLELHALPVHGTEAQPVEGQLVQRLASLIQVFHVNISIAPWEITVPSRGSECDLVLSAGGLQVSREDDLFRWSCMVLSHNIAGDSLLKLSGTSQLDAEGRSHPHVQTNCQLVCRLGLPVQLLEALLDLPILASPAAEASRQRHITQKPMPSALVRHSIFLEAQTISLHFALSEAAPPLRFLADALHLKLDHIDESAQQLQLGIQHITCGPDGGVLLRFTSAGSRTAEALHASRIAQRGSAQTSLGVGTLQLELKAHCVQHVLCHVQQLQALLLKAARQSGASPPAAGQGDTLQPPAASERHETSLHIFSAVATVLDEHGGTLVRFALQAGAASSVQEGGTLQSATARVTVEVSRQREGDVLHAAISAQKSSPSQQSGAVPEWEVQILGTHARTAQVTLHDDLLDVVQKLHSFSQQCKQGLSTSSGQEELKTATRQCSDPEHPRLEAGSAHCTAVLRCPALDVVLQPFQVDGKSSEATAGLHFMGAVVGVSFGPAGISRAQVQLESVGGTGRLRLACDVEQALLDASWSHEKQGGVVTVLAGHVDCEVDSSLLAFFKPPLQADEPSLTQPAILVSTHENSAPQRAYRHMHSIKVFFVGGSVALRHSETCMSASMGQLSLVAHAESSERTQGNIDMRDIRVSMVTNADSVIEVLTVDPIFGALVLGCEGGAALSSLSLNTHNVAVQLPVIPLRKFAQSLKSVTHSAVTSMQAQAHVLTRILLPSAKAATVQYTELPQVQQLLPDMSNTFAKYLTSTLYSNPVQHECRDAWMACATSLDVSFVLDAACTGEGSLPPIAPASTCIVLPLAALASDTFTVSQDAGQGVPCMDAAEAQLNESKSDAATRLVLAQCALLGDTATGQASTAVHLGASTRLSGVEAGCPWWGAVAFSTPSPVLCTGMAFSHSAALETVIASAQKHYRGRLSSYTGSLAMLQEDQEVDFAQWHITSKSTRQRNKQASPRHRLQLIACQLHAFDLSLQSYVHVADFKVPLDHADSAGLQDCLQWWWRMPKSQLQLVNSQRERGGFAASAWLVKWRLEDVCDVIGMALPSPVARMDLHSCPVLRHELLLPVGAALAQSLHMKCVEQSQTHKSAVRLNVGSCIASVHAEAVLDRPLAQAQMRSIAAHAIAQGPTSNSAVHIANTEISVLDLQQHVKQNVAVLSGLELASRVATTQQCRNTSLAAGHGEGAGSISDSEDNDISGDLSARILSEESSNGLSLFAHQCSVLVSPGIVAGLGNLQHALQTGKAPQSNGSAFDVEVFNTTAQPIVRHKLGSGQSALGSGVAGQLTVVAGASATIGVAFTSAAAEALLHASFPQLLPAAPVQPLRCSWNATCRRFDMFGGWEFVNCLPVAIELLATSESMAPVPSSPIQLDANTHGSLGVSASVGAAHIDCIRIQQCIAGSQDDLNDCFVAVRISTEAIQRIVQNGSIFCVITLPAETGNELHATCTLRYDTEHCRVQVVFAPLVSFTSAGHTARLSCSKTISDIVLHDGCIGVDDWRLHLSERPPSSLDSLQACADFAQANTQSGDHRILSGSSSVDVPIQTMLGALERIIVGSTRFYLPPSTRATETQVVSARAVPIEDRPGESEPGTAIVAVNFHEKYQPQAALISVLIEPCVTLQNSTSVLFAVGTSTEHQEEPGGCSADQWTDCAAGDHVRLWSIVPKTGAARTLRFAVKYGQNTAAVQLPLGGTPCVVTIENAPADTIQLVFTCVLNKHGVAHICAEHALAVNNATDMDIVLAGCAARDDGIIVVDSMHSTLSSQTHGTSPLCILQGPLTHFSCYCMQTQPSQTPHPKPVWSGAVRLGGGSPESLPISESNSNVAPTQYTLQVPVFGAAGATAELGYVQLSAARSSGGVVTITISPSDAAPALVHNHCPVPLLLRSEATQARVTGEDMANDPLQILAVCLPDCGSAFVPPQQRLEIFPGALVEAAKQFRELWQSPAFRSRHSDSSTVPAVLQPVRVSSQVFPDAAKLVAHERLHDTLPKLHLGIGEAPSPEMVPEVAWAETPVAGVLPLWLGQLPACAPPLHVLTSSASVLRRHQQVVKVGTQHLSVVRAVHCGRLHVFVLPLSQLADLLTAASINDELLLLHSVKRQQTVTASVGLLQMVCQFESSDMSHGASPPSQHVLLSLRGVWGRHALRSTSTKALVYSAAGTAMELPTCTLAPAIAVDSASAGLQLLQLDNHLQQSSALVPVLLRVAPERGEPIVQLQNTQLSTKAGAVNDFPPDSCGKSFGTGSMHVDVRLANSVQDDAKALQEAFKRPLQVVTGLLVQLPTSQSGAVDPPADLLSTNQAVSTQDLQRWCALRFQPVSVRATIHITRPVQLSFSGVPFGTGLIHAEQVLAPSSRLQQELLASVLADAVLSAPAALGAFDAIGNPTRVIQAAVSTLRGVFIAPFSALGGRFIPAAFAAGQASQEAVSLSPQKLQEVIQQRAQQQPGGVSTAALDAAAALLGAVSGISASVARNLDSISLRSQAEVQAAERRRTAGAAQAGRDDDAGSAGTAAAAADDGMSNGSSLRQRDASGGLTALSSALYTGLGVATSAVLQGARGVVAQPLRDTSSLRSVLAGVGAGAVGAVARPIAGVADAVWHASQGVLQATGRGTALGQLGASSSTRQLQHGADAND